MHGQLNYLVIVSYLQMPNVYAVVCTMHVHVDDGVFGTAGPKEDSRAWIRI